MEWTDGWTDGISRRTQYRTVATLQRTETYPACSPESRSGLVELASSAEDERRAVGVNLSRNLLPVRQHGLTRCYMPRTLARILTVAIHFTSTQSQT